jgi:nucleoside 2-deoxyribosyltransferase
MRNGKIYIATRLENAAQHAELAKRLAGEEIGVTYDWTVHGRVKDSAERMAEVSAAEIRGIRNADCVVALLPGGRGTHAEIGAALALRVPVVIYDPDGSLVDPGEETCAFYHHPGVVEVVDGPWGHYTIGDLVAATFRAIEESRS